MCAEQGSMQGPPGAAGSVTVVAGTGGSVVRVEGDLDLATTAALFEGLADGIASVEDLLVVDLTACGFIASQPYRAIEDAAAFLRARGGALVVLEPPTSFRLISGFLGDRCALSVQGARSDVG
jgi:anti-anti-sigma regulatory factor